MSMLFFSNYYYYDCKLICCLFDRYLNIIYLKVIIIDVFEKLKMLFHVMSPKQTDIFKGYLQDTICNVIKSVYLPVCD